jgi:hypothetical protein
MATQKYQHPRCWKINPVWQEIIWVHSSNSSRWFNDLLKLYTAANERTFLAWVRTSLSLITVGVGKFGE